jgi:hypothetical protein
VTVKNAEVRNIIMLLGDMVQRALTLIGVTPERVHRLWGECNCAERKEYLNHLHRWARVALGGVVTGRMTLADAKRHYDTIMEDFENVVKERKKDKTSG